MSSRRSDAALKRFAPVFAALGDETRLRLVARLSTGGPASTSELGEGSGVSRQAIAKHLNVLAAAGVVRSIRQGRDSIWELDPRRIEETRRSLERIASQWDDALDRLKAFVESVEE